MVTLSRSVRCLSIMGAILTGLRVFDDFKVSLTSFLVKESFSVNDCLCGHVSGGPLFFVFDRLAYGKMLGAVRLNEMMTMFSGTGLFVNCSMLPKMEPLFK